MRMTLRSLGLLVFLSFPAMAQEAKPLDLSLVPAQGQAPKDFVPAGWKIENTVRGDLNKDGSEDVVLQLIQDGPESNVDGELNEYSRALVALFSEGGGLRRAGASNKVLYCTACTGTMGSGPGELKIQKGVILLSQISGARESLGSLLRFRYEPKDRRFVLIGQDLEHRDRLTGETEKVSTNLLTGQQITEKLRYDEKKDKDLTLSSKKQKVAVKRTFLEDVNIESL